jgi:alpha-soluble NSF attachment protein
MNFDDKEKYNKSAEGFVKKAQKALKGGFFKNMLSSKGERIDEGLENYDKAINNYKLAKNWKECANLNLECAKLARANNNKREEAEFYAQAGQYYIKAEMEEEGIKAFKEAVIIYKDNGNFDQSALYLKKIGEFYEGEENIVLAAEFYLQSADLYALSKFHVTDIEKLKIKVADIYSKMFESSDKLLQAVKIYEEVAHSYLNNNLMRFHASKLFFNCVLVFLVLDDDVGAEKMLEKYKDEDPSFNNGYESKFLANIIKAVRENNEEEFGNECFKLNSRMTLDKDKTYMLTEIKKKLKKQDKMEDEFDPL